MPIYEYQCLGCGHSFEYLLRSTSPAASCPACSGAALEQKISLAATSSDGQRHASLMGAHKRAAAGRSERQRAAHTESHHHFED